MEKRRGFWWELKDAYLYRRWQGSQWLAERLAAVSRLHHLRLCAHRGEKPAPINVELVPGRTLERHGKVH